MMPTQLNAHVVVQDTSEADLREMGRRLRIAVAATAAETQGFTG